MLAERPTNIQRDIEFRVTNGLGYERMFEAPNKPVDDLELQMHLYGMDMFVSPYFHTNDLLFEAILDISTQLEDMGVEPDGSIATPKDVMDIAIPHAAKMLRISTKRMRVMLDTDNLEFILDQATSAEISSQNK